jgi:hypothetical protein
MFAVFRNRFRHRRRRSHLSSSTSRANIHTFGIPASFQPVQKNKPPPTQLPHHHQWQPTNNLENPPALYTGIVNGHNGRESCRVDNDLSRQEGRTDIEQLHSNHFAVKHERSRLMQRHGSTAAALPQPHCSGAAATGN